jgi:hypothetical protein
MKDSYRWINQHAIPRHSWAAVPGAFFLFENDYKLVESNWMRLGVGSLDPNDQKLDEAFDVLLKAVQTG